MLDNSGSMSGGPLETCKRAMQSQIFATRLHECDQAGLLVFNSGIHAQVQMSSWNVAHRNHLESTLRSVQATGGTNLWHAMNVAIDMLLSSNSNRSKWLVALTDGVSSGSPDPVRVRLNSSHGSEIKVLFITVGLGSDYEAIIRKACIRAEGDAIIRADSLGSIEQAWQDVGNRLTVSEQIEKHGESITSDECSALLRKHMKLDSTHKDWSRLKQSHWIRYLFRRCKILASSEKFNKNKDMPKFGSTTMTIMLDEVWHFLRTQSANHDPILMLRVPSLRAHAGRALSCRRLSGRLARSQSRAICVLRGDCDGRWQVCGRLQVECTCDKPRGDRC